MSLPASWAIVPMGKIIDLKYGKSLPEKVRSGTGFPVYGSNGVVGWHEPPLTESAAIVIGRKGSVGEVNYSSVPCFPIDTTYYVDDVPGGVLKFWYYQLKNLGLGGLNKSTAIPGLSRSDAYLLDVKFPPVNEQHRIADKLDRVLARVDAANEHLSRVGPLLKRFRQEVLASAFTGGLTENFRSVRRLTAPEDAVSALGELPRPNRYKTRTDAVIAGDYALSVNDAGMDIPAGWLWIPMVDIARMESGHTPSKSVSAYWGGDVPWIGIADARNNHSSTIDDTIQKTSKLGLANSAARLLPAGTVCVSRTASVGYVVKMGRPMATSQDFVNWVCADVIDPDWLKWLFVAERRALHRFGKGSTHTTVYFPEWLSLHVALPSIEEQREIVARIDCLMEYADELEDRLLSVKTKCQAFVPALLSKAFRGELVSQNPNDEPASELLARLAEAEASENQKRIRRKRQASA